MKDKTPNWQKIQYNHSELDVLDNVKYYEVRKFLGVGDWHVEAYEDKDVAIQRKNELKPQSVVYAIGDMPSRGGIEGACFVSGND